MQWIGGVFLGKMEGKKVKVKTKKRVLVCELRKGGEHFLASPSIAPLRASRSGMEKGMIIFLPHPQSLSSRRGRHLAT